MDIPETTGMDNDSDSISGSEATVALDGLEAKDNTDELLPNNQAKLMAQMREINDLCQWIETREGQPAESLDCIEWELQSLSLMLQPQPPQTPTEPFGEVICLCQEPGHINCNCPHIRCYKSDEYGHIVMDCPHRIPPSATPGTHHKPHRSHHARLSSRHHHYERDRQS